MVTMPLTPPSSDRIYGTKRRLEDNDESRGKKAAVESPGMATPVKTPAASPTGTLIAAKSALRRSTASVAVLGREREASTLRNFITESKDRQEGACLYVCGPPGTGKSTICSHILNEHQETSHVIMINCMSMHDSGEIFVKLAEELSITHNEETSKRKLLSEALKKDRVILVLDEVDYFLSKSNELLYFLFSLPFEHSSKLCLISIANTIDLVDRFLPRLTIPYACPHKPNVLVFKPYTAPEISHILVDRLEQCKSLHLFQRPAIELCARKVAATSGDVRKALDICRRAVEHAENNRFLQIQKHQRASLPLSPLSDTNSITNEASSTLNGCVTISLLARVAGTAFGKTNVQRLRECNLHQKAVLCAMASKRREGVKCVSLNELQSYYKTLCRRDRLLSPLSCSEFSDIIAGLEGCGLITQSSGPNSLMRKRPFNEKDQKVELQVSDMDLLSAVGEIGALLRFFD